MLELYSGDSFSIKLKRKLYNCAGNDAGVGY